MPVDVKKWLAEAAAAAGLEASEIAAAEKLLGSTKFRGDFVPVSDFHSTLDRQKSQYQKQVDELMDLNAQWQEAYDTQYAPALNAVQQLQGAGYDVNGLRNDGRGGVVNSQGQQFTLEDVQKLIRDAVEPVRAGVVDYGTFIADKSVEYRDEYGKRFPAEKFREYAFQNRDKFSNFDQAYAAFTEEDRKVKEAENLEKWKADEREKIRLELMSSQNLPEAGMGGADGSPLFIANEMTDAPSRDEVRQSFVKTFANTDFSKVNV